MDSTDLLVDRLNCPSSDVFTVSWSQLLCNSTEDPGAIFRGAHFLLATNIERHWPFRIYMVVSLCRLNTFNLRGAKGFWVYFTDAVNLQPCQHIHVCSEISCFTDCGSLVNCVVHVRHCHPENRIPIRVATSSTASVPFVYRLLYLLDQFSHISNAVAVKAKA